MSLLKHENKHWPLALMIAHGQATLEQHHESLISWDNWFARAEPFHSIRVYLDGESLNHPKGAAQATQRWMSEGAADQMRDLVQSMLIVVPPTHYDRMQKMSVRKAFGLSGGIFRSLDEAFAWLDNPPEPIGGTPVDQMMLDDLRQTVEAQILEIQTLETQTLHAITSTSQPSGSLFESASSHDSSSYGDA